MKNHLIIKSVALCLLAAISLFGCGGSSGGGRTVEEISSTELTSETGAVGSGISKNGTQTLQGVVPNPGGDSASSFQGKAYLVLNGEKIQLDVVNPSSKRAVEKHFTKGGQDYVMKNGITYPAGSEKLSENTSGKAAGAITWQFEVTFSINAGPNSLAIEVYDLNDTLFARLDQWNVIGAMEPTNLVVTLSWNTNKTDIDLHVADLDDTSIHCYYDNDVAGPLVLDYDDTDGYGPEHVTLDDVVGSKTYGIKVYYYADHNEDANGDPVVPETPTTATVTAQVNGETIISESHQMTSSSTADGWGSGAHIWDVGEIDVHGANVYTVALAQPDLTDYPTVQLTLTVDDENGDDVENLTADNFYVVNAGTIMSPITIAHEGSGVYSVSYTDITAGARDLYVFIYQEEDDVVKGGLSSTATYGKNYALLVGMKEYPPAAVAANNWRDNNSTNPTETYIYTTITRDDDSPQFTGILTNSTIDGLADAPITFTAVRTSDTSVFEYELTANITGVANYLSYQSLIVKYDKGAWLDNAVNDVNDMRVALLNRSTGMTDSAWKSADITSLHNSAATEAAVTTKIAEIANAMNKYDTFLFMFSGHGSNGTSDSNQYLCTYEDENWISVTELSDALKDIKKPGGEITNLYVIIDACHSGNFIGAKGTDGGQAANNGATLKYRPFIPQADESTAMGKSFTSKDLQEMTNKSHLFVLTAVTGDKESWDDPELGNGVFAYYLLQGLGLDHGDNSMKNINEAPANTNKDPWITAEEAYIYSDPLAIARVAEANGYPADAVEDPQQYDNSTSTLSRLIYNW